VTARYDLARLLRPRSVAVVGASERPETYGSETLRNLELLGFEGEVWGVNPRRSSVYGRPCFASLSELPSVPDAVVVAIPADGVVSVVEEAGRLGCGGAVVYASGFGETPSGAPLEAALRDCASRWRLPLCGPNCDGLIALHSRAALWGDALADPQPGHVALVSQSGNLVVNALATRRGLRLHTAISSGNETVLTTPDYVEHLAGEPEVRSVALLLESDGDGARLCEALARCTDAGVRVAVLKVGVSATGAAAAAAHTGAVAGDHRVFRALMKEAGAAWADDVHDLLELAKALAVRRRDDAAAGRDEVVAGPDEIVARPRGGVAILTCSGGDSGLGADEAARRGLDLPALAAPTVAALRERLPAAATVANPLDYTALIWGERDTLRDIVRLVGEDPAVDQVLVFYDRPPGISGYAAESWEAVEDGILAGAGASPVPVIVASTLPELLDDDTAWTFAEAGVPAVAGLRTGVACAAALGVPTGDAARLREIAGACVRRSGSGRWLAEHEAKALLRGYGVAVVEGRTAGTEEEAVEAFGVLGGPVAVKVSSAALRHKSQAGAIVLDVRDESGVRAAWQRFHEGGVSPNFAIGEVSLPTPLKAQFEPETRSGRVSLNAQFEAAGRPEATILVERMAPPGAELLVAVRTDAVTPALAIGLGGVWTEALDDVAIVPLPAGPSRVERALHELKGAPTLQDLDLPAAARLAARLGEVALEADLELLECNPVIVHRHGAVIVDATAKEVAT
jgi:acyl-CoA synthetase (NDP forming)